MDIFGLSQEIERGHIKALVVDVDGTLYRQSPVRYRMFMRLLKQTVVRPRDMYQVWRALQAYRNAQETMRETCPQCADLAAEQVRTAAAACGLSNDIMAMHVGTWMETAPLDLLQASRRADVWDCLRKAKQHGLQLGVWSDYPAAAKLHAMDGEGMFDVVVCAQDHDVARFKPDPRGLEVALAKLGVAGTDAVYIGDRPEVDGLAALRAGVPFVGVGPAAARPSGSQPPRH
jgi:HAD superfamily hydrolase (TIGR01549 family)